MLRNGLEIRSFLSVYNGLGSLVHFKAVKCTLNPQNPSVNYPVMDSLANNNHNLGAYSTDLKHLDFYVTYLKSFCNEQYIKK